MKGSPNFLTVLTFFLFFHQFLICNVTASFPNEALPTNSGYLPVNSTSRSAMFYTYYEAQKPISPLTQTPLLIWLEGGPGCSSMLGNFFLFGPWIVSDSLDKHQIPILKPNPVSWNHLFGLLFIDNPIGTGFSIASAQEEIPRDQETVAKHLFFAIQSFMALNPMFKSRPIYIVGQSYAGKYVPAIGYYILQQNSQSSLSQQLNLKGVAIGNGLTDPITQAATHAATAYYFGLINENQRSQLEELQSETVKLVQQGKWGEATNARTGVFSALQKMIRVSVYDIRKIHPYSSELVTVYLNNNETEKALHVSKSMQWKPCSIDVAATLSEDVMKSVKFMVEEIVKSTKVLLYQGQFDLRDGVVSTEAWIKTLKWEGLEKFLTAERKVWEVNGEVAGYVQRGSMLSEVIVAGAGHGVLADQASNSRAMIEDWVLERGLFDVV